MLWHIRQQRRRQPARKIPVASVVLWPICRIRMNVGALAGLISRDSSWAERRGRHGRTRFASRVARRSTGMKMRRKTRLSRAKALAARYCASVCRRVSSENQWPASGGRNAEGDGGMGFAHDHSVSPGKYSEFIEAGNEIPSGGDVASYEYAKSQDGEGVHRIALRATDGACRKG